MDSLAIKWGIEVEETAVAQTYLLVNKKSNCGVIFLFSLQCPRVCRGQNNGTQSRRDRWKTVK